MESENFNPPKRNTIVNINEDFVFKRLAIILKEKGFNELTYFYYDNNIIKQALMEINNTLLSQRLGNYISAPTLQMVNKWLREVHKFHITIKPYITEDGMMFLYEIYKLEKYKFTLIKTKTGFYTNEFANNTAIEYCLSIIK